MAPKYKFTYFKASVGRGELVRLIFAAAGVEFEDVRLEREEWRLLKETSPMGQLPMLEVGGQVICQSGAIYRYAAKETGLSGAAGWEEAQVDMFVSGMEDLTMKMYGVYFERDEAKKLTYADLAFFNGMDDILKKHPDALEKYPKLAKVVESVKANKGVATYIAERPETLSQEGLIETMVMDSVNANPKIAALIAKRPDASF
ncbi:HPGDS [Branchiostoma lanceolatum]|uniref:glutathione transferase n=1 Tax=Branchiostoma lanceolatum TaxID=7740 RepID=A0A8J9Z4S0_BRALA|nr:HPGDS [Branchiostoma lanceolatum]